MLYLILFYLLLTFICFWAGILVYSFSFSGKRSERPLIFYCISGLISLTAIAQCAVLFTPLNTPIFWGILLLMGLVSFFKRKILDERMKLIRESISVKDKSFLLCFTCFFLMIVVINAGPTVMDDTDSYHIQMIKWVQEFGTVPGLANLHLRFGLNSSWFISAGLMSPSGLKFNHYLILNGTLSIWIVYHFLNKIFQSANQGGHQQGMRLAVLILVIFCVIDWPMLRGNASSANYDFITTSCIVLLFIEGMDSRPTSEWYFWPLYLFTIRLINLPLLFLSLYFLLAEKRSLKNWVFYLVTGLILILPFIFRNIILSGYAFFPVYQLDFFSFDWKADREKLVEIMQYIKYYNRVNPMFEPLSKTMTMGFPAWIWPWYKNLFRFDLILVTISIISYAAIFIRWNKFFVKANASKKVFVLTMFAQLICWFGIAPDPRFAYGPLLFGIFVIVSQFKFSRHNAGFNMARTGILFLSILVLGYTVQKIIIDPSYRNWIKPRPLPVPPLRTIMVDGLEMHIPEKILNNWNPRCYDVSLPCLYKLDPRLEPRGKSLREGFRISKSRSSDKVEGEYKITE